MIPPLPTSDFDYDLPRKYIAQSSVEPRDHSNLMVLDRDTGKITHRKFFEIIEYLQPGDLVVWNTTKAFKARLFGKTSQGIDVELFLLNPTIDAHHWKALVRPGKKVAVGDQITIADGFVCKVITKHDSGVIVVRFVMSGEEVRQLANAHGHIPIPPYVDQEPQSIEAYQTVYAQEEGSVAAPTAGFHFTQSLVEQLKTKGVEFAQIVLHVGLGTFAPMKTNRLDEHTMHAEYVQVSTQAADQITRAKQEGRRVIAVGTTTVRTLEGVAAMHDGNIVAYAGEVNLFITPGFAFKIVDGLITNFHLPKSTLLVLVSAYANREFILRAYEEAKTHDYRFYSFGDVMFLL